MNLQIAFPSSTPGAVVDIKKGRSSIAFTQAEIAFAQKLFELLAGTPQPAQDIVEEVLTSNQS